MKIPAFGLRGACFTFALAASGCANSGIAIYHYTVAGRAAIQATTPLIADGSVEPTIGADVNASGWALHAALVAWNNARQSGDLNALAAASNAAEGALVALEGRLADLQASYQQSGDQKAAGSAARLLIHPFRGYGPGASKAACDRGKRTIAPEAVAAIIEIAVTEMPVLVNWINSALSAGTVSDAQIQTELDGMAADLGALETAINGHR